MLFTHKNVFTLAAISALLAGCAVGPDFKKPAAKLASSTFERAKQNSAVSSSLVEKPIVNEWWALFNDPILNELQARAQHANLDIKIATSRVAQSRAQLGVASAALLPKAGVSGTYSREALSENGPMAKLGAKSTPHDFWQGGFDASWEIDLWGHASRNKEAANAALLASEYQREGVLISIAAEVARNYLLLRSAQSQIGIVEETIASYEHLLKLTRSREKHGAASNFDTASASANLSLSQARLPQLKQQADALMNALALLLGELPRSLEQELVPVKAIPSLPPEVPVGLPSELVERRPDILQAASNLHAATASIGAVKADFYPRIKLVGSVGLQALQSGDFGNWSSRQFNIGPTLYLPIFEGGRLKSTLALTKAKEQEAGIAYQQTVLRAWHEVDNAFNVYTLEQQRRVQLINAVTQSKKAYRIAERRYQAGASNYLSVLIAQNTLLASQLQLNGSHADTAVSMVALYKALGGGWGDASANLAGGVEP